MKTKTMRLKILLPYQVLLEESNLVKIDVETSAGVREICPQESDSVAVLNPGILSYQPAGKGAVYVAVSSGVLVKSGLDVAVSVGRAVIGPDVTKLREEVENHFLNLDHEERTMRTALANVEQRSRAEFPGAPARSLQAWPEFPVMRKIG